MSKHSRGAALVQGTLYVATGLWPIVHLRSFERVTGPKRDRWLVQTMGGLITAVGAALLVGARAGRSTPAMRVLGVGSALALGLADVVFTARGRIPPVYLADAVAEAGLAAAWLRTR